MKEDLNIFDIIRLAEKAGNLKEMSFYKQMSKKDKKEFKKYMLVFTAHASALVIESVAGDFDEDEDEFQEMVHLFEKEGGNE